MASKRKVEASMKCKKAIANMVENGGNVSKAMREAGYSPQTAKNPSKLTESKAYKQETKKMIEALDKEIWRAISAMPNKIDKATYNDMTAGIQKMHNVKSLLGGDSTDNTVMTIKWADDE